jgi:hypothetical protein
MFGGDFGNPGVQCKPDSKKTHESSHEVHFNQMNAKGEKDNLASIIAWMYVI